MYIVYGIVIQAVEEALQIERPGCETFEREFVTFYENCDLRGHRIAIRPTYFPLRADVSFITHVAVLYRDVTAFAEQEAQIAKGRALLAAQQQLIQELSSPVARLWDGILLLPPVSSIDFDRSQLSMKPRATWERPNH